MSERNPDHPGGWTPKVVAGQMQEHHHGFVRHVIGILRAPPKYTLAQFAAFPSLNDGEAELQRKLADDPIEHIVQISQASFVVNMTVWCYAWESHFPSSDSRQRYFSEVIECNRTLEKKDIQSFELDSMRAAISYHPIYQESSPELRYTGFLKLMGRYLTLLDGNPGALDLTRIATYLEWVFTQRGRRDALTQCLALGYFNAFQGVIPSDDVFGWTVLSGHLGGYFFEFFERLLRLYGRVVINNPTHP